MQDGWSGKFSRFFTGLLPAHAPEILNRPNFSSLELKIVHCSFSENIHFAGGTVSECLSCDETFSNSMGNVS